MPWTVAEVDAHMKGLTDKQKETWCKIANSALSKCETDKGKDCDASAIRQANAVLGKMKEAAALGDDAAKLESLIEAGRVLSAKNESRIRSARDELDTVLSALDKKDGAAQESLSEAERSFNDIECALRAAIPELQPSGPDKYDGGWLTDVFDGFCVYQGRREGGLGSMGPKYYRRSYAIDSAGKVTLGQAEEVQRKVVYEPAAAPVSEASAAPPVGSVPLVESCAFVACDMPLVEAAALPSTENKSPLLKLIAVGPGSKGYYTAEVLKRDGPKAFPKGTFNRWDHMTEAERKAQPEGSIDRLASVQVEDAKFLEGAAAPDGAGLYARVNVFSDYAQKVKEKGPHIGISIDAHGDVKEAEVDGKKTRIVTAIYPSRFNTSDYVTLAGAGGKVLQESLTESARPPAGPQPQGAEMSMNGAPGGAASNTGAGAGSGADEHLTEAALNLKVQGLRTERDTLNAKLQESETAKGALMLENQKLAGRLATRAAQDFVGKKCKESAVPEHVTERLKESLPGALKMKGDALDEEAFGPLVEKAIRDEMAYYAQISGSGRPQGNGGSGGAGISLEEAQKRYEAALVNGGLRESTAKVAVYGRSALSGALAILIGLFALLAGSASAETNRVYSPGWTLNVNVTDPNAAASGDPVRYGLLTGVAQTDEASDGKTSVDFGPGVWDLSVDDDGGTAIAVGAAIYYHDTATGSPATHLNNVAASADAFFGVALETVTTNGTSTINVLHIPVGLTSTLASNSVASANITNGVILPADEAYPGRGQFTVCGDATTVNNNTIYYGPDQTVVSSATVGLGRKCDTTAAGNATEGTADAPAYNAQAFQILSMDCTHPDAGAALTFTARTAAGATVPSVTCTDADNDTDCIANIQTTTAIASGATFAVAVSSSGDIGTVPFVCVVDVAF